MKFVHMENVVLKDYKRIHHHAIGVKHIVMDQELVRVLSDTQQSWD